MIDRQTYLQTPLHIYIVLWRYDGQLYLQMIRLFEEHNCPDLVLRLAGLAITEAEPNDPNLVNTSLD